MENTNRIYLRALEPEDYKTSIKSFLELGLNRVEALVLKSNIGSIRMHKKCGYVEEGIKRHSVYKNGKFQDQVLLAILKNNHESEL